ncbi:MAG TPA: GNAT family protein [Intrasporangium sp.]|nr:GNAT family protein [Intrasporangium sp.]
MPLTSSIVLRPLRPGEFAEARPADSEFDDFGPRSGHVVPPPCRLDEDGVLAVVVDGQPAGTVSWTWVQWGPTRASRCPMIGIWVQAGARGSGAGSEAQRQLVGLFFRHTATNRVQAHTDVANLAEQRALEKAGFTAEGIVRGAHWRDGDWHDGHLYSVLRSEWRR